jgi:hypothetical protein
MPGGSARADSRRFELGRGKTYRCKAAQVDEQLEGSAGNRHIGGWQGIAEFNREIDNRLRRPGVCDRSCAESTHARDYCSPKQI